MRLNAACILKRIAFMNVFCVLEDLGDVDIAVIALGPH